MRNLHSRLYLTVVRFLPLIIAVAAAVLVVFPLLAWADAAQVPTVPGTNAQVAPADPFANPSSLAQMALWLVQHKSGAGIAALLVIVIIGALKKFAPATSSVGVWLNSQTGGWVVNLVLTNGTAFLLAALAGTQFNWTTVLTLLGSGSSVGFVATGIRELLKDVGILKPATSVAASAGQAAAANPGPTLKS